MTIDDIIKAFQDYANGRRLSITDEVVAAIPILREAKENAEFVDDPTCPKCGKDLDLWNDSEGEDVHISAYCRYCGKSYHIESRHRVVP